MTTAIDICNLRKEYKGLVAVNDLNLTIEDGELFALLGVNGAGKTTTIKMLCGLSTPTAGDADIGGYSLVRDTDKIKELLDVSMQETAIARKLTVAENIRFYASLSGQNAQEVQTTLQEAYAAFGLDEVKDKKACTLSGGWQRKLSIALALSSHPKLLFLDEPTLGLDVLARRDLWRTIEALKGRMTIILTTHYMEEAEALADRIGIMQKGRLLFVGTPDELYQATGCSHVEDAFVQIVQEGESHA